MKWMIPMLCTAIVLLSMLVAGCAGGRYARMVETSETFGGVQSGPRGGLVEYVEWTNYKYGYAALFRGTAEDRHQDALSKMEAYCAPHPYKVLRTQRRTEYGSKGSRYRYVTVQFVCVESQ